MWDVWELVRKKAIDDDLYFVKVCSGWGHEWHAALIGVRARWQMRANIFR